MRRALIVPVVLGLCWVPPAARAQQPPEDPRLVRVASMTPWIDRERPLSITLQIANSSELALEDATVRLSVYGKVLSRSQLRNALAGQRPTPLVAALTESVAARVEPGEQRAATVRRPASALGIGLTGVYPLEITVAHARGEVTLRTAIPFVGTAPEAGLNLAWVMPITAPTIEDPAGSFSTTAVDSLGMPVLKQQLDEIAARRAPVTLAPNPSLLDTLADLGDGFVRLDGARSVAESETSPSAQQARALLTTLRDAAEAAGEIATVPYAPASLPALARANLRADLVRQVTLGRAAIERSLGRAPSRGTLVPPGLLVDGASSALLGATGVARVVADGATLPVQPDEPFEPGLFGPSRPVTLAAPAVSMRAALADQELRVLTDAEEHGVLTGQRIVAETASAWLELPGRAPERLLVIAPASLPSPAAIGHALDGLSTAPWIRLRTLTESIDALPPRGDDLPFPPPPPAPPHLAEARAARRAFTTLSKIAVAQTPSADRLERLILLAESAEWDAAPVRGTALARAVQDRVSAVTRDIQVQPRQVTLTARRGEIPVTLVNRNQFPVRVRVELRSSRVGFPDGAGRVEELGPEDSTFDVAVEARATGSFPIQVVVQTPDGSTVLASGTLIVRSTAVSAVALLVTGGGTAFLFAASFRRQAKRNRAAARG